MSIEDNIRVAEEHIEAESAHDLERLLATLADDCVYEDSLLEAPIRGKAAVRDYYEQLWRGFPDFTYEITNRVADEQCVVYEMTFRGTHTGAFRDFPPTYRSGVMKSVVIFPMRDGKALGERIYVDGLSFLTQMGVLPHPSSGLARALVRLTVLRLSFERLLRRYLPISFTRPKR